VLKRTFGAMVVLTGLVLAAPALMEVPATAAPVASAAGPAATGGWTNSIGQTISLNAVVLGNGAVNGKLLAGMPGMPRILRGDVDCVFVEGNYAYVSGVVTHFLFDPSVVGSSFLVRVIDHADGDSHSPFFFFDELVPDLCLDPDVRDELEEFTADNGLERFVTHGNIVVH